MKLIKLQHDHYVVIQNGVEIASTKPAKGVESLDLFEVRQIISNMSRIPEELKTKFESLDWDFMNEAIRMYTLGYMRAEEILKSLERKLSWNVEFIDGKLKLK